jgi:hypothetical protein
LLEGNDYDHDDGDDDDNNNIFFIMSYGHEFHSMTIKVTFNADSEKVSFSRNFAAFHAVRLNIPEKIPTYRKNTE